MTENRVPTRCVACDNDLIQGHCPIHGDLTSRAILQGIGGTRWANEGDEQPVSPLDLERLRERLPEVLAYHLADVIGGDPDWSDFTNRILDEVARDD